MAEGQSQDGNIVSSAFAPVLAKHTKSFNLIDTLAVGVDRIQRNFEPLQRQVELWRKTQVTDERQTSCACPDSYEEHWNGAN